MSEEKDDDGMTPEQRLAWLRERGVMIETPEERRRAQVAEALREAENLPQERITFVEIPHDSSRPLEEKSFAIPLEKSSADGDLLLTYLKPAFGGGSKTVDLKLFKEHATQQLGNVEASVSEAALAQVASEGSVESFSLVHATPSNDFTAINIYLDEVGMLKRLPLNSRASDYAARAGFNPPPQFYGDVYIGRIKTKPVLRNVSFELGKDTAADAEWLQKATMQNLEYQTSMNQITGRNEVQPALAGDDGVAKVEDGYSWTQTEDEIEVVIPVPGDVTTKDVKVKFLSKSISVEVRKTEMVGMKLFDHIDTDGSTWTLDRGTESKDGDLTITLEKRDANGWPRLTH